MKSLFLRILQFSLLAIAVFGQASAQVFYVGGDSLPLFSCTHTDLQSAIDAADPNQTTEIRIANNQSYTEQSLVIDDRSITLRGGYGSCLEAVTQEPDLDQRTVLDGSGLGRVLDISAPPGAERQVRLENLEIRGGVADQGAGMRIEGVRGSVTTTLRNVRISNNSATGFGGGVAVVLNNNPALNEIPMLVFEVSGPGSGNLAWNVRLTDNEATGSESSGLGGGGLACRGIASAFNTAPIIIVDRGLFEDNRAGSSDSRAGGGGIALHRCSALLALGSPGGEAGIFDNEARTAGSGGIQVTSESELFIHGDRIDGRGTPGQAAVIGNNINGGINSVNSRVLASGLAVVDNIPGNVTLAGLTIVSSLFELLPGSAPASDCLAAPAGRAYPACNLIAGNQGGAQSGAASALSMSSIGSEPATAFLSNVVIRDNGSTSSALVPSVASMGGDTQLILRHALVLENFNGRWLFSHGRTGSGQANVDIAWSTIAGNQLGADPTAAVFRVRNNSNDDAMKVNLAGSVIWQPDRPLFVGNIVDSSIRCMIGSQLAADLPIDSLAFYDNINPEFVDLAAGDLRPGPSSPLIDYCDGEDIQGDLEGDINGIIRGINYDLPITPAPNRVPGGLFDLGAFEVEQQRLFRDRFESP